MNDPDAAAITMMPKVPPQLIHTNFSRPSSVNMARKETICYYLY